MRNTPSQNFIQYKGGCYRFSPPDFIKCYFFVVCYGLFSFTGPKVETLKLEINSDFQNWFGQTLHSNAFFLKMEYSQAQIYAIFMECFRTLVRKIQGRPRKLTIVQESPMKKKNLRLISIFASYLWIFCDVSPCDIVFYIFNAFWSFIFWKVFLCIVIFLSLR